MNAKVVLDVWFDVESMNENDVKSIIEDAIDAYHGCAHIYSVELTPDED
ncbi:hypothetical protein KAMFAM_189 [Bacillus phage Kamfam]|nr:hypothetical protein OTK52_187 [Bacillus phage OTooleKemple52]ASR79807.1 hypothetical protein JANET_189 [Bacillus phage Janet]AXQ67166.1 hypothetical protein KAMFAM_189 [Bacillus phage Kamfam]